MRRRPHPQSPRVSLDFSGSSCRRIAGEVAALGCSVTSPHNLLTTGFTEARTPRAVPVDSVVR
jgi:hypothetical protein